MIKKLKNYQTATNKLFITESRNIFYCNIKIKIPINFKSSLLAEAFSLIENIDRQYNSYSKDSYFSKINVNSGKWTDVDETTLFLLSHIKSISKIVDGHYDISVMPLLKLWGVYTADGKIKPSQELIRETLEDVDSEKIEINGNRVRIQSDMELITASFIKSYAVDQAVKFLRSEGVDSALINAGGSTIIGMGTNDNNPWLVEIPVFDESGKKSSKIINLSNEAVNFSGSINNFLMINNRKYSHVISGKTGLPSTNKQAIVFSTDAFFGDCISTALLSSPSHKIQKYAYDLKKIYSFEGYLTDKDFNNINL